MNILIANNIYFNIPQDWIAGTIVPSSRSGYVNFRRAEDNKSLTLNPRVMNSSYQFKGIDDAAYEQFLVSKSGDKLVSDYDGYRVIQMVILD